MSIKNQKKLTLLVCYEKGCGGETIATEQICNELSKKGSLSLKKFSASPLRKTNFVSYFLWIFGSIIYWTKIIFKKRGASWVYITTYTAGVAATLLKPISNYKICFHYHGSRLPEKYEGKNIKIKFTQRIKRKTVFFLHYFFLVNINLVITPSPYSQKLLKKLFPVLKNEKIAVIANGVDLSTFKPSTNKAKLSLRKKYGIDPEKKVVTYIGRLNKQKGINLLIKTTQILKNKIPNIALLIAHPKISTPEERVFKRKLKEQIAKVSLSERVLWVVGEKDISDLYNISDLVISLSRRENFPLIMLEALACKTLFVSTPVGGVKEVLDKVDKRLIFEDTNPKLIVKKIKFLSELPEKEIRRVTTKGYKIAKKYSWRKTSKLLEQHLKAYC